MKQATQAALLLTTALLCGCGGIAGPGNTAAVRVIVTSPNSPGVDLYVNAAPIAYNLGFGNITSYVPLAAGATTLAANTTGTRQTLTAGSTSLGKGAQYTVVLGDTIANLQQTVLRDQNSPSPAGQVALRFLDQATTAGAVDIFLVPSGAPMGSGVPLLSGQTFGANSGYLNLPAGAYRIVLCAAGGTPAIPLHTGPLIEYTPGSARTLILLDQKAHGNAALQLVTAVDYDPPA